MLEEMRNALDQNVRKVRVIADILVVGVELFEPAEDEVEKFREFLDQISPDDFEN